MGELEQAVMAALWELDDEQWATVRQVHESLADRALAYTTVMTVMDRLARKEYVEQQRDGRAYRYRPRVSRAALTAELMRETLTDMDAAERGSALVSFVADSGPDDIAALRRALDDLAPDDRA
jgi:predicted transcriptional regulator